MIRNVTNALLYQLVWFCGVLGGNRFIWLAAIALLLQLWLSNKRVADVKMMGLFLVAGMTIDGLLQATGVLKFAEPGWPIPLWLVLIWLSLANTVHHSLSWLMTRPTWATIFGCIGGPLAYWAGTRLGAATFGYGPQFTIALLALIWALLFLLLSVVLLSSATRKTSRRR
jgi:hypothetical protein